MTDWNLPASQAEQASELLFAAIEPGLHWVGAAAPSVHALPSGHVSQSVWALLLELPEELPAAQSVGATAPAEQ